MAPGGYTKGATDLARSTGVSLFDAESIRRWIRQVDKLKRGREGAGGAEPKASQAHVEYVAISEEVKEARKRAFWHPHPDDPSQD